MADFTREEIEERLEEYRELIAAREEEDAGLGLGGSRTSLTFSGFIFTYVSEFSLWEI